MDFYNKTIALTGGLGYIGSHIVVELLTQYTCNVIIIDNLINSSSLMSDKIETLIDKNKIDNIKYYNVDLLDIDSLSMIFSNNEIDIVIHLAGLKSVNESIIKPMLYYDYFYNYYYNIWFIDYKEI